MMPPCSFVARIEPLESRIAPAYLLNVTDVTIKLPAVVLPGDSGSVTFTITNNGDSIYNDDHGIIVELSPDNDPLGASIEVVHDENSVPVIKPGDSKRITKTFKVPPLQLPNPEIPEGMVFVVVDVRASGDYGVSEGRPYVWKFGNVDGRTGSLKLPVEDSDGTLVSFKLSGKGTGHIVAPGNSTANLEFTGTDLASAAGMTGRGGNGAILLDNISANAPMGQIKMLEIDTRGDLSFPQGLKTGLQLRDVGIMGPTDHSLTIGSGTGTDQAVKLVFRSVKDMEFGVTPGISSLFVNEWLSPNGNPDAISTKFLGRLKTAAKGEFSGDFHANLAITSGNAKMVGLESAVIDGNMRGTIWTIGFMDPVNVGPISAAIVENFQLKTTGAVKEIEFEGLNNAGLADGTVALEALSFGDIVIGGTVRASVIRALGATVDKVAINTLDVGEVLDLSVEATAGGIMKITANRWNSSDTITTKFIGALNIQGDRSGLEGDTDLSLNLNGPDKITEGGKERFDAPRSIRGSLGATTIDGAINGGTWNLAYSSGAIKAEATTSLWTLSGSSTHTFIASLTTEENMFGTITAGRIGKLTAGKDFAADVSATDSTAGAIEDVLVRGAIVGGSFKAVTIIGSITADEWVTGSADTGGINDLTLLGDRRAGIAGDMNGVTLTLRSTLGFEEIRVAGSMFAVNISTNSQHHVSSIKATSWEGGGITGGTLGSLQLTGDLKDVTFNLNGTSSLVDQGDIKSLIVGGLLGNATIVAAHGIDTLSVKSILNATVTATGFLNSLTVKGLGAGAAAFVNSVINAGAMEKVLIYDVSEAGASGISADSIVAYDRYAAGVKVKTLKNLDAAGTPDQAGGYTLTIR